METEHPEAGNHRVKDANDLLKHWVAEGVCAEEQGRLVKGMLAAADPMVLRAAAWAGELSGPERDEALRDAWMDTHKCVEIDAILFADANALHELLAAGHRCQAMREYRVAYRRYYAHLCECKWCAME